MLSIEGSLLEGAMTTKPSKRVSPTLFSAVTVASDPDWPRNVVENAEMSRIVNVSL